MRRTFEGQCHRARARLNGRRKLLSLSAVLWGVLLLAFSPPATADDLRIFLMPMEHAKPGKPALTKSALKADYPNLVIENDEVQWDSLRIRHHHWLYGQLQQIAADEGEKIHIRFLSWQHALKDLTGQYKGKYAVCQVPSTWAALLIKEGILAKAPEFDPNEYLEQLLPTCRGEEDDYYAIPWHVDFRVLYYRKVLTKDPTRFVRFSDFKKCLAERQADLKKRGSSDPMPMGMGITRDWDLLHNPFNWAFGGTFWVKTSRGWRAAIATGKPRDGLSKLWSLSSEGLIRFVPADEGRGEQEWQTLARLMREGEFDAMLGGPHCRVAFATNPEIHATLPPQMIDGRKHTFLGGSHLGVTIWSAEHGKGDFAAEVVRRLTAYDAACGLYQHTDAMPARVDAFQEFIRKNPRWEPFDAAVKAGHPYPASPEWPQYVETPEALDAFHNLLVKIADRRDFRTEVVPLLETAAGIIQLPLKEEVVVVEPPVPPTTQGATGEENATGGWSLIGLIRRHAFSAVILLALLCLSLLILLVLRRLRLDLRRELDRLRARIVTRSTGSRDKLVNAIEAVKEGIGAGPADSQSALVGQLKQLGGKVDAVTGKINELISREEQDSALDEQTDQIDVIAAGVYDFQEEYPSAAGLLDSFLSEWREFRHVVTEFVEKREEQDAQAAKGAQFSWGGIGDAHRAWENITIRRLEGDAVQISAVSGASDNMFSKGRYTREQLGLGPPRLWNLLWDLAEHCPEKLMPVGKKKKDALQTAKKRLQEQLVRFFDLDEEQQPIIVETLPAGEKRKENLRFYKARMLLVIPELYVLDVQIMSGQETVEWSALSLGLAITGDGYDSLLLEAPSFTIAAHAETKEESDGKPSTSTIPSKDERSVETHKVPLVVLDLTNDQLELLKQAVTCEQCKIGRPLKKDFHAVNEALSKYICGVMGDPLSMEPDGCRRNFSLYDDSC